MRKPAPASIVLLVLVTSGCGSDDATRRLASGPPAPLVAPRPEADEILVRIPSVPGYRLDAALLARIEEAIGPHTDRCGHVAGSELLRFSLSGRTSVEAAIAKVVRLGADAQPNFTYRAAGIPNDPQFCEQWPLQNTGQAAAGQGAVPGDDIGAVGAWDRVTGGKAGVIVVVDTGIDYDHPDLADNIWTNLDDPPGNGDKDQNGYIDDV